MNGVKYFLDTNIFVYSYDPRVISKQKVALNLIENTLDSGKGIISFQVVQEFLSAMTLRFSHKLTVEDLNDYLTVVLSPLCTVFPSEQLYKKALDIHKMARISFYDALVIAAALQQHCTILYTEDLQHGQTIAGVKIQNPFLK